MISTRTIASDGTVMTSQRRPRVIIHRKYHEKIPCLSVNHCCLHLERIWGRRVSKAALNTKARWLNEKLTDLEMQISFPNSRRGTLPDTDSQAPTSPRPARAACHLES